MYGKVVDLGLAAAMAIAFTGLVLCVAQAGLLLTHAGGADGAVVSTCSALQTDYSLGTGCNAIAFPLFR